MFGIFSFDSDRETIVGNLMVGVMCMEFLIYGKEFLVLSKK